MGVLAVGDTGWYVRTFEGMPDACLSQADTIVKDADSVQEKVMQTQWSMAGDP